jgi:hypothetical protein
MHLPRVLPSGLQDQALGCLAESWMLSEIVIADSGHGSCSTSPTTITAADVESRAKGAKENTIYHLTLFVCFRVQHRAVAATSGDMGKNTCAIDISVRFMGSRNGVTRTGTYRVPWF